MNCYYVTVVNCLKVAPLKIQHDNTSARPKVRGTADVGWRSLFSLPLNPPRTHSRLYHHMCLYGPTGSDGQEWMVPTRTLVAHHFWPFEAKGVLLLGAPSSQPTVPLHELHPARLVIHRQTSAHEQRKWTRSVQSRSGILAYLCTRQH